MIGDSRTKIAIVGTGLSGLAAGISLSKNQKIDVHFFEKNDCVGGRVATIRKNGYIMDKGFQVILSAYPHFQEYIKNLRTRPLGRGATFVIDGSPITVDFSLSGALSFIKNWRKIGEISDFLKLLSAVFKVPSGKLNTSVDLISSLNFSPKFEKNFLYPFFRGVLNSSSIDTNISYFRFLLKMFSKGPVIVPVGGMAEMPKSMLKDLESNPNVSFHFKKNVQEIKESKIICGKGEEYDFDHIICAVDVWALPKIDGARKVQVDRSKETSLTTFYVKTKGISYHPSLLILPVGNFKINHISPMSGVYGTESPYLSVNVLDLNTEFSEVVKELSELFSNDKNCFELINEQRIEHVLPKKFYMGDLPYEDNGVYYCGDYLESPSIDGALLSGKKVADLLLSNLN
jgi:phytoene dehydrogenase-like protein